MLGVSTFSRGFRRLGLARKKAHMSYTCCTSIPDAERLSENVYLHPSVIPSVRFHESGQTDVSVYIPQAFNRYRYSEMRMAGVLYSIKMDMGSILSIKPSEQENLGMRSAMSRCRRKMESERRKNADEKESG